MNISKKNFIKELHKTPDIYENFWSISYQMKYDILNYFKYNNTVLNCIEFGTHKGYSTRILSHIFDEVVSLDINKDFLTCAREFNKDRKNIKFIEIDLFNHVQWNEKIFKYYKNKIDVAFIDGKHSYEGCKNDIINAYKLGCKYFIFDDTGLYEDVKRAVNEFTEEQKILNNIEEIVDIGIEWRNYNLPLLVNSSLPLYLGGPHLEVSFIQDIHWELQDKRDIEINGTDTKPFFDNMNVRITALKGLNEVLQNGIHKIVVDSMGDQVYSWIYNDDTTMTMSTGDEGKKSIEKEFDTVEDRFVPIPFHRIQTEMHAFMGSEYNFEEKTKFEGVIVKLKKSGDK